MILLRSTLGCLLLLGSPAFAICSKPLVTIETHHGKIRYQVEIADTFISRARGLMHRDTLDQGMGMLFQYDKAMPVTFWMKNVSTPLDIIFVGADSEIVKIHANATPFDLTPIPSGEAVRSVLEIRGGASKRAQIKIGDHARLECEAN